MAYKSMGVYLTTSGKRGIRCDSVYIAGRHVSARQMHELLFPLSSGICVTDFVESQAQNGWRIDRPPVPDPTFSAQVSLLQFHEVGTDDPTSVRACCEKNGLTNQRWCRPCQSTLDAGARTSILDGHCGCAYDGREKTDLWL